MSKSLAQAVLALQLQVLPLRLASETSIPARGETSTSGHCRSQVCASLQEAPLIVGTLALLSASARTKPTAVAVMKGFPMLGRCLVYYR